MNMKTLTKCLDKHDCQITRTTSIVNSKEEHGVIIKFFKTNQNEIKKIWEKLKKCFNLKCAFVQHDSYYMGCILNWPGVFSKNNCICRSEKY